MDVAISEPPALYQRQELPRRRALTILAGWSIGLSSVDALAVPANETRQAEILRQADFVDANGALHRLSELTRPLLLVNLWAAWCPGCVSELRSIRAFADRLGPDSIDVVMLSHTMNWPGDVAYVHNRAIPFRHWRLAPRAADSIVSAAFRIEDDRFGLPQSLVLTGRERILAASNLGTQDWSAPQQIRLARAWLAAAG